MSSSQYMEEACRIIERIRETQSEAIRKAALRMAESIAQGGWVYLFGSGHSVIAPLDIFPRYGSFVGFYPLLDPRLMWFNVTGPGGAPELLWLERQEGYVANFLGSYTFTPHDTLVVYSHGGLNAAPIDAALYVRERGSQVVAVTSMENCRASKPRHSSGKKLSDVADVVIDNCVPPEDALVDVGEREKVGAGSTLAVVLISMALVAETAVELRRRGVDLHTFVSPNVPGVASHHNEDVFQRHRERLRGS